MPCPSILLRAGSYTFPLNAWRIRHYCGIAFSSFGGRLLSPGCIEYTAPNGERVSYTLIKMPKGWRIAAVEVSGGTWRFGRP